MRSVMALVAIAALGAAVVAACTSFSSSNDAAPADGGVGEGGPPDAPADAPAATTTLYVIGGYVTDGGVAALDEVLAAPIAADGTPGAFVPVAKKLPSPLAGPIALSLAGDIVVVGGGSPGAFSTSVFHTSDPAAGWSTAPSLPVPRRSFAAATDGAHVIVLGGQTNESPSAPDFPENLVAQPVPGGSITPWVADGRYQDSNMYGSLALVQGTVIIAGGVDQGRVDTVRTARIVGDAIAIDDAGINAVFADQAPLPAPVANAAMVAVDRALYVIGGTNGSNAAVAAVSRGTVAADGSIGAWNIESPLPSASASACATSSGRTIYVVGGDLGGLANPIANVWIGTVGALGDVDWKAGPSLPTPRTAVGCVVR